MRSIGTVDFESYLSSKADRIDDSLEEFFDRGPDIPNLTDAARYSMGLDISDRAMRGKRVRPVLCLLTCESLGGSEQVAMPFAISSEIMHNFLLVHDDIEDKDEVRRNRPAVWVKYDVTHGINVGDYLYAKTYEAAQGCLEKGLDKDRMNRLFEIITRTIVHTGEGQALDINARSRRDLTIDEYLHLTVEKTGYYLACPAIGGALIAGADDEVLTILEEYGKCIGPVFQITDDVIDLTEGKGRGERGSDIKEGKRSYLVVSTGSECTEAERERMYDILDKSRGGTTKDDVEWVSGLFKKYGAVDKARRAGRELLDKGQTTLSRLPVDLGKNLLSTSQYMLERKK